MAHHKRHRPKNARSGCLLCKPHKSNGCKHQEKLPVQKQLLNFDEQKDLPIVQELKKYHVSWL